MRPIHSRSRPQAEPFPDRGFTLVELMIGVFLAGIVLFFAGNIYLSTVRSFAVGSRRVLAQREASLLTTAISRQIRIGSSVRVYDVPDRDVPADSGNGIAVFDSVGGLMGRMEWSPADSTLVDSSGTRVTATELRGIQFRVEPAGPRFVRFRYETDDGKGNQIDIESAVTLRN